MSKARQRLGSKRARERRRNGSTYDGVTDAMIFDRDGWRCRMPECLHPGGREITRGLPPDNPWRGSIDHVIRVADGGDDTAANKRSAHSRCNSRNADVMASQENDERQEDSHARKPGTG